MGGTPEQSDRDGGRDRAEGIGVQLTADTTEQDLSEAEEEISSAFSLPSLPTVKQQIRAIEAPMQAQYADEITIPVEVVDEILRTGSNRNKSQLRLIYNFMTEQTPEEYTAFVKKEYGEGGKGFEIGGTKYAVWFDELGMQIAVGDTVRNDPKNKAFLSWEDVSGRIHQLLQQGEYAPKSVLDAARGNVLHEHAEALSYMERDMAEGVAEMVFADTSIFSGGYPELTERLAKLLDQPEFLADLNERLLGLAEAYAEDKSVMRMQFYRPDKVSEQFQKFALPFQPYQAREGFQWNEQKVFITEDEINAFLAGGGPYSDGRLATYSFFLNHEEKAERAAFLKDRYGVGGSSHALSRADNSHANYDGRGLELARGSYGKPDALVKLNWNQAAERVAKLIDQSLYLKPADYSRMPSYEREQMANRVIGFYHRLPDEVERPFERELLNEDARKKLPVMLADSEQAAELLEKMDVRTGKIQCIVVKDLSRFGRDYIETGNYLETIFPMLHIRFIAINDDFDNIRQSDVDSLAVPIKNMVNSLYAKDISKKIGLSYQMRREKGIPTSWCVPYGYRMNEQKSQYEVADEAKYVKLIYQWYLMGVSTNEIARRLEFLEVPRPNEHLNRRLHEGHDTTFNKWHSSSVLRMITSY